MVPILASLLLLPCPIPSRFFLLIIRRPPRSPLFPTRRSSDLPVAHHCQPQRCTVVIVNTVLDDSGRPAPLPRPSALRDRKSTRLNSSHANISYAVFCLKKKKTKTEIQPSKQPTRRDEQTPKTE